MPYHFIYPPHHEGRSVKILSGIRSVRGTIKVWGNPCMKKHLSLNQVVRRNSSYSSSGIQNLAKAFWVSRTKVREQMPACAICSSNLVVQRSGNIKHKDMGSSVQPLRSPWTKPLTRLATEFYNWLIPRSDLNNYSDGMCRKKKITFYDLTKVSVSVHKTAGLC